MKQDSSKSIVMTVRIPIPLLQAMDARIARQRAMPETRNEYIVRVLHNEVIRKHRKVKPQ